MKALATLTFPLILVGCASQPLYNLNASASDVSRAIEESDSSVYVSEPLNRPSYESDHGHTSIGVSTSEISREIVESDGPVYVTESSYQSSYEAEHIEVGNHYDSYSSHQERKTHSGLKSTGDYTLVFTQRTTLNKDGSPYELDDGYGLALSLGDSSAMIRAEVYLQDAHFMSSETDGFDTPYLFGLDVDLLKVIPQQSVNVVIGGRLSFQSLSYDFKQTVVVEGVPFYSDSFTLFGLGVPVGLRTSFGHFAIDAMATPSLYIGDSTTHIGFKNDIDFFRVDIPLTLGIGYRF